MIDASKAPLGHGRELIMHCVADRTMAADPKPRNLRSRPHDIGMDAKALPIQSAASLQALAHFVAQHPRLLVLTGAGVSTASGIPDYRDLDGGWKRPAPMTLQQFMGSELAQARYWARSMLGWRHVARAQPNSAHRALAELERRGRIELLVTQNVDRLHQRAGSRKVVDLHGRLDRVRCMTCRRRLDRDRFQQQLEQANPEWLQHRAEIAPDGDVYLEDVEFSRFDVPPCPHCGGILKPDVVYFGEGVPRNRVRRANRALERADALLVIGSSLMVFSGYRFAAMAQRLGKPVAALHHGRNRADPLLELKVEADCGEGLQALLASI